MHCTSIIIIISTFVNKVKFGHDDFWSSHSVHSSLAVLGDTNRIYTFTVHEHHFMYANLTIWIMYDLVQSRPYD